MPRNLTLLTDFYQLTMMNGYFKSGKGEERAVFDMFFRPKGQMTYAVSAGLQQAVEYIQSLHFTEDDIVYLREVGGFTDERFLAYLRGFRFTGDMYAVREGEIVFPGEPILTVHAPLVEAQLIETALLNIVNHQTLIATKASRVVTATGAGRVTEFGLRRAQGPDAGIYGARAAVIGGASATSNVFAAKEFGITPKGTHSHSWVLSFDSELEAFEAYADAYPDSCLLLVDTYDTLKSGVPNAIRVLSKLKAGGHTPLGIRLDSGDLAYLSKRARAMLDAAGLEDAKIFVSNEIDETLVAALKEQGAKIDLYGVGTKLITSESMPSLGGVYKLAQIERNGKAIPRMKVSDSLEKITNPGFKTFYRIYAPEDGKAVADLIALRGETFRKPLVLTHETERWKKLTLDEYRLEEIPVKIFEKGKLVYTLPRLSEIAAYRETQLNRFWDEYKRLSNPHIYKVDLSDGLYQLKQQLLNGVHNGSMH